MASIKKYATAKGDRWRVQYRTPDRRLTTRRGFLTKRDAENFAATTHVSKLRGEYVDPADSRVTIGELGPDWLARRAHLKPSSRHVEEIAWRIHVEPKWGRVKIADVRNSAVQSWVVDMGRTVADREGKVTKKGSGAVTIRRALDVLAGIFDEAVRDRRLVMNPARGVKLPRKEAREHSYLTEAQLWQLSEAASDGRAGDDKAVILLLLGYCGLRWGELAGLHVADVDMLSRRLHVRRNAVNVGGEVIVGTPKTHERRTIHFPKFLVEPLSVVCQGKGRDDIVFPAARGGYAKSPGANTWFSGAVARCQTAADEARAKERKASPDVEPTTPEFPRVTPHDLRHTAASLAVSVGANVKVVQKMLGHKSATMTLDTYADLFDRDAESVADAHDERQTSIIATNVVKMSSDASGRRA
ncbi:site-specific integrase [Gordonia polyisoprenivorans]|uniref:tyrosine-type recombinase/integrase n=1 Tax=Gordonia polyisoprenivorans TaxID=84595 RepID=UPI001B8B7102|nr:site-specific integrase [Gordonia polyisoprenivorans]QUD84771.1 site-specific integrase [Gordonia polyisoprenivorans]